MSSMTLRQSQVLPGSVSCWWLLLEVVSSSLFGSAAGGGDSPAAADCWHATPVRDQSRATTRLMLRILYHNIPPPQGGALLVPISILLVVVFTGNWRRLEFWCNTNWCILLKYPLKCINVFTLFFTSCLMIWWDLLVVLLVMQKLSGLVMSGAEISQGNSGLLV